MKTILSILILIIFFGCSEIDTTATDEPTYQRSSLFDATGKFVSTTIKVEKYAHQKKKVHDYLNMAKMAWYYQDSIPDKDSNNVRVTRIFSQYGEDYTMDIQIEDFDRMATEAGFRIIQIHEAIYNQEEYHDVRLIVDSWDSYYDMPREGNPDPYTNVLFFGSYGTELDQVHYHVVFEIVADSLYQASIK